MNGPIPKKILDELLDLVHVDISPKGEIRSMVYPNAKQILARFSEAGGAKLHHTFDEIYEQFNNAVSVALPKWRASMMARKKDAAEMAIVLQQSLKGRYASGLLHGRYQVLESPTVTNTYYIVDHTQFDEETYRHDWKATVRRQASKGDGVPEPIEFNDKDEALRFVDRLAKGEKPAKVTAKAQAPAKAPAAAPKVETNGRKPSMASVTRELLQAGGKTDEQIYEIVVAQFPTFRRTSVAWYRKELGL